MTGLEYEKEDILHDVMILESKLIELGIPPKKIDKIKDSVLSS